MNNMCEWLYIINQKKKEFTIEPGNQKNKMCELSISQSIFKLDNHKTQNMYPPR